MYYYELLKTIMDNGDKVKTHFGNTKELIDRKLEITQEYNFPCTKTARTFDHCWKYESHELPWYFSGDRKHNYISKYAKMWKDITNVNGTLNSNYGFLIYYMLPGKPLHAGEKIYTAFEWAYQNLKKDKESRRAVILYNAREFNYLSNRDYICSQEQHFMIRNNELICIIPLRSSDAIFGLTFNMPWWSIVQQDLWLRLLQTYPDLKIGNITVNIHSAHIYEKHFKLVEEMLCDEKDDRKITLLKPISLNLGSTAEQYFLKLHEYIKVE